MTDNEVIKALERCSIDYNCGDCPYYYKDEGCCPDILMNDALDLINRQKAEIERLLQKLQQAQSEAIKEFAERLKEKLQWDVEFDNRLVFESDIENLVKEMTEENK